MFIAIGVGLLVRFQAIGMWLAKPNPLPGFLAGLRRLEPPQEKQERIQKFGVLLLGLAMVIAGFYIMFTPD